ncbi:flavin reductase [Mycetohabitans sp. B5]|uniref:flavin reductase family protein n=1 Tax=Mycetohabitans TaxID=2571159 RepID=UPI000CE42835|nr:flavin reductase [Mycetohabitans sp. B5]
MYAGAPVLDDALATFDCRIANATRHGTHSAIVGEVVDLRLGPAPIDALVYFNRHYHVVASSC